MVDTNLQDSLLCGKLIQYNWGKLYVIYFDQNTMIIYTIAKISCLKLGRRVQDPMKSFHIHVRMQDEN